MDRTRLTKWLENPHHTFRYRLEEDDEEHYRAVETTADSLVYYRWSHQIEDGGRQEREVQSIEHYRARGPIKPLPELVRSAIDAWFETQEER
ncbi:MAG: hypothetical protein AAF550_01355 [Myxococcota bacterium]